MITKKLDYLNEQLENLVMYATTEALKYPGENNFREFEKEYETVRAIMADYGEKSVPLFEDAFYKSYRHLKANLDKSSQSYWLNEGRFNKMFIKENMDETHKFIDNEFVEFIVAENDPEKKQFLSAVHDYMRKLVKIEKKTRRA